MNNNIEYYNQNAEELCALYDGLNFEQVHHEWLEYIPKKGAVLDIGAGSGRDARYFASKSLSTYAVEPAEELLDQAKSNSKSYKVNWIQDQLPTLSCIFSLDMQYDLILLSAIWMHLTPQERKESMVSISNLLSTSGIVVITLRYGSFSDGRTSSNVSIEELQELAKSNQLKLIYQTDLETDQLGRDDLAWQTVVLGK